MIRRSNKKEAETNQAPKKIPELTIIKLWTASGGRCEFNGCNEYLLKDSLTLEEANFSNIGHIVGRSVDGPRGSYDLPVSERNKANNLMLLCLKHHKLIDDKGLEIKYPVELLKYYKKEHEDKVFEVTKIQTGNKTFVVRVRSHINGESVCITPDCIKKAIHPKYMTDEVGMEIDLTSLPVGEDDDSYWKIGQKVISEKIESIYKAGVEKKEITHISVFAIGPIPFLIFLGNRLSNVIPTDLFLFQKDLEDWTWKNDGDTVKYKLRLISEGREDSKVALVLSLSGPIKKEDLPKNTENYWIYEITLDGLIPNRLFMKKKEDLLGFKNVYRQFLSEIRIKHKDVKEILLFPAIPPAVAISCGRDLIKKTDPSLIIYDFNKNLGGFREILTIN